jgi:hypothetical protein
MKYKTLIAAMLAASVLTGCGVVDEGNVGVRKTFGKVNPEPVGTGFYTSFVSAVDEYTTKETNIELQNLTPKAKDNLSLKDMDIAVYYKTNGATIPALTVKYIGQSNCSSSVCFPGSVMVESVARSVIYDTVSRYDSLVIHTKRDELEAAIKEAIQRELNNNDPATFTVTRVIARSIVTDPAIEASIKAAVAAQKQLEQMTVQEEIAVKQAQIKITEAKGISEANKIINNSLTREYLQHEANQALMKFAETGANTVVVPANMNITPMINTNK